MMTQPIEVRRSIRSVWRTAWSVLVTFGAYVALAPLLYAAESVTVSDVDGLTNAVARANAGEVDRIILKSGITYSPTDQWMRDDGTSKYFLLITVDGLVIEGENASPRSTWTDHDEPTVIDCGGLGTAVLLDESSGRNRVTLKNITITGATGHGAVTVQKGTGGNLSYYDYAICTNCVFRQNECTIAESTGVMLRGTMYDCFVTNNTALNLANVAIMKICKVYGCDFVENSAPGRDILRATSAFDCSFRDNSAADVCTCVDNSSTPLEFRRCTFSGNSTTGNSIGYGGLFIDCIFEDNRPSASGYVVSGRLYSNANLTYRLFCTNCVFRRNLRAARNPISLYNCTFEENGPTSNSDPTYGSAVYLCYGVTSRIERCTFLRNTSGRYRAGGAIFMARTTDYPAASALVTNCVFEGNAAWGSYSHGGAICNADNYPPQQSMNSQFPSGGNLLDGSFLVADCTFLTNTSLNAAGVYGVKAVNCRFYGNVGTEMTYDGDFYGCDAKKSHLVNCELTGGDLFDCVVDRCHVHDATNSLQTTFRAVFRGSTFVTNTLVERCAARALYDPRNALDAEFVNCTIVSNDLYTFKATDTMVATTNALSFKNCLFHGNRKANGRDTDLDVYDAMSAEYVSFISFSDTYYGHVADDNLLSPPAGTARCADPKFAGKNASLMRKNPSEPYWALSYSSPLLGKGNVLGFTDADFDLAGRVRVRDGGIDIGCYQCWLYPPGMAIIVK